ncbi:FKBP-type peptidyl-prolyl cis-trans isomerase FklB [Pseudarcicella hirudinis]|uniref:Peptidyl-prolyl cis-trans isomerase n=1 Tax=Pseudarcicella hirudinis TaxID=1079859 RepID=A0A1I5P660_9BACT|nr:FKBP-type peptidyl-prolyl cis-trans isomerase [Pseudarcicella hirudinis]SFP29290.1 FKBP-type peptidyl-prolyl cis-trans isomerase FklB [Pseudarcicella hirudinis]
MHLKKFVVCAGLALTPVLANAQAKKTVASTKPKVTTKTTSAKPSAAIPGTLKLSSLNDSVSYGIGLLVAQNFKSQGMDLNPDLLSKAISDVLKGGTPLLSDMVAQQTANRYMMKVQEQKMAEQAKQFEPNKLAGEKFLAENAKKEGVVTLPSGLQYQILKAGDGPKPTANDKVKTHYHGTLIDGTVFDSSVQRGEPITFPVTGVIQGWVEALQLMPVGSKWKLFVPENLAYGIRGSGPTIKPYSALVFEVELLSIEK